MSLNILIDYNKLCMEMEVLKLANLVLVFGRKREGVSFDGVKLSLKFERAFWVTSNVLFGSHQILDFIQNISVSRITV